jgi:hypothetical protein
MNQQTSTTLLLILAIAGASAHGQENAEPDRPLADLEIAGSPFPTPGVEEGAEGGVTVFTVFMRAAGSNFVPRDSTTTFSYDGGGCMQRDSNIGDSWFTYDLQVPNGAELDFFRVYYFDGSATFDVNAELWSFDGAGGTTMIAEADSTGDAGYGSTGSPFFSHIVDSVNESLVVVASLQGGVGNQVRLCGIRVRYQRPGLFQDGFETGDASAWNTTVESD